MPFSSMITVRHVMQNVVIRVVASSVPLLLIAADAPTQTASIPAPALRSGRIAALRRNYDGAAAPGFPTDKHDRGGKPAAIASMVYRDARKIDGEGRFEQAATAYRSLIET